MLRQVVGSRTGSLLDEPADHDATVREVGTLVARPIGPPHRFMVNVDGLRLETAGTVRVEVSGRVLLLEARRSDQEPATGVSALGTG